METITEIFDTHCHLDLISERGLSLSESLREAQGAGLGALLQIATDLPSSRWNEALPEEAVRLGVDKGLKLYWTAGLHPESADQIATLDEIFLIAKRNLLNPYFWGLGETGLDYFHTTEHKSQQLESLERHLDFARQYDLPIVLHTRDARSYDPEKTASVSDAYELCRRYPEVKGVLHCFTYTEKEASPFVEMGWFVSYSGVLTFKNARVVQDGAVRLPLDSLLVETDAPFLAPTPHRGELNQPAFVRHTHDFLVQLRSERNAEDPKEIRWALFQNSQRFLSLKKAAQAA